MSRRLQLMCAAFLLLLSQQTWGHTQTTPIAQPAQKHIVLGILAYRPKPLVERQWSPLIRYLNQAVPGTRFSLRTLNFKEMEKAVAEHRIDLVFTQPANYVYLSYRYGLSSPMATEVDMAGDTHLHHIAGTILVKNDRQDLKRLSDLEGKRIATPSICAFGAYQSLRYEMQKAGVEMPEGDRLLQTGMPHDRAVDELLSDNVDAAFVRAGLLEELEHDGSIGHGLLRVLNKKNFPDFPFAASSQLYPQWPVAAMKHLENHEANRIAAALLNLPHGGEVARQIGIDGFNIPMDYYPVMDVLKALRAPPYEHAPSFTPQDIWEKYSWQIVSVLISGTVLIALILMLLRNNMVLSELRLRAEEGDNRLKALSERVPGMIYQYHQRADGTAHYPYISESGVKSIGLSAEILNESAEHFFQMIHPDDRDAFREKIRQSAETMEEWRCEFRLVLPDGRVQWRLSRALPEALDDGSIMWHGYSADITDRKEVEAQRELLVAALEASANAITITDLKGRMEWVNQAFVEITGYSREELIGNNPRMFKSGKHDAHFYQDMWHALNTGKSWRGEIVNRRKDGTLKDEELIIAPVADEKGRIHHYIGVKQDISERKRMETELRTQATTDALTGLSNRRHFFQRAEEELARIKRRNATEAAVVMLDIDFFKRVNDTYGHSVGDMVLKHAADLMLRSIRITDCCGRFGGEEFAVLLHETDLDAAVQFSERLREVFEKTPVVTETDTIHFTVSFGVTIMNEHERSVDHAIIRADEALYRAKESGRNRVIVA